jgi:predicted DNA-binding protein
MMKLEIEITEEMKERLDTLAASKGLTAEDVAKFILADALMTREVTSLGRMIDDILGRVRKLFPL